MRPLHAGHRRADRFAELVDGTGDVTGDAGAGGGLDQLSLELLELVGALRSVPDVRPRPEFVADLRAQLMAQAHAADRPAEDAVADRATSDRLTVTRGRRPRERRVAVAVGAFAIVGATTSMAVASQGALPGDALYPLKRAIEDTHTSLSLGDRAKGTTLLDNAEDRLAETRDLSRGGADADSVTSTLHTFSDQAEQGADLLTRDYLDQGNTESINQIRDFAAASIAKLSELDGVVPEGAQPALVDAAKRVFLIDAAAGQLCPTCASTGITEMPGVLLSSGKLTQSPPVTGSSTAPTPEPRFTVSGGPQTVPSTTISIAPSLIPTPRPSATGSTSAGPTAAPPTEGPSADASSTGPVGDVGDLTGDDDGGGSPKPTTSDLIDPTDVASEASTAVSDVATAVGDVVSDAASDVGTLLGGVLGTEQDGG